MATLVESSTTSDDDDSIEDEKVASGSFRNGDFQGRLFKWTNYLHGWQERYLILKQGFLNYYKSEVDIGLGCRGALSVRQADIQVRVTRSQLIHCRHFDYDDCFLISKESTIFCDMIVSIFSHTNSMSVVLMYALVIQFGIYVLILMTIVSDGFKL